MKRSDKKFVWLFFLFPMAKIPHLYSGCQVFRGLFSEKVYWCSQMIYVLFGGKNTILKMRSQVFEGLFWRTKIHLCKKLGKKVFESSDNAEFFSQAHGVVQSFKCSNYQEIFGIETRRNLTNLWLLEFLLLHNYKLAEAQNKLQKFFFKNPKCLKKN